jgi:c-di-GMP-binding flagellar brake protein YcgR
MNDKNDINLERRRSQRFGCCMPAQCRRLGNIKDETLGALTKDVSQGGTRLVTESFIPVNSRVVVILSFPFKNQSVKALCKVVWSKRFETLSRYDLGIEFIDMTAKTRTNISYLIKTQNLD